MTDTNNTWTSFKPLALALHAQYCDIDVLSLSDSRLVQMIESLNNISDFSPLPKDTKDFLFAVKVALACVIENDENYDAHQDDAYV